MRLVLPTLWSPSKTIFVRFGGVDEKSAVAGVDKASIAGVSMCRVAGFQAVASVVFRAGPGHYDIGLLLFGSTHILVFTHTIIRT
jgi:hypothetical protein